VFDFENAEVVSRLPARFLSGTLEPFPPELTGAQIVFIGTLADNEVVEGGGLVIDCRDAASDQIRRFVFGFNDLGMWVEFQAVQGVEPTQGEVRESV
jgi:hypothetical protein